MVFEDWDPWEEERKLREFIIRMIRDAWSPFRRPWREFREELRYEGFPIDLSDTDGELVLYADLPGFEKDDVRIHVTEDTIDIRAEKRREKRVETKTMYRQERAMGTLRRFMSLPVKVDPEGVDAEFKDGVLTIRMKKKEVKKGKEVKIR
ncbi:MAG: Hsp20/alpha crystallin family protein [Candidatus Aenigmarchaeota archaeon]|nr:Hsp20/alpha crystallin family protein [Candidatus Aenigmarchaeota archaeon]